MAKSRKKKKAQRSAEDIAIHKEYVEKQRRKASLSIFIIIVCVLGLVICAMLLPASINGSQNPYTYSEYQELSEGMSYDDVCSALGGKGSLQTGSPEALNSDRTDVTAVYTWANKNGSSVSVAFSGGKAQSVAQDGLDSGK
jgi:flagellar basal body-associated protein FliL